MHMKHIIRSVVALTVAISFLAVGLITSPTTPSAFAQDGTNVPLTNGDFEGSFVSVGGDVTTQVAEGWQPFDLTEAAEFGGAQFQKAPENRNNSGSGAQSYNTVFGEHDAGILQQVSVPNNAELEFSVFVYVWSAESFDDVNVSEDPLGVIVEVGIDPTGGTDPTSDSIVWDAFDENDDGTPDEYYDRYEENTVQATAQGTTVTVFVRTTAERTEGVTEIDIDDASLVAFDAGGSETEEPTDEPTEEPTDDATDDPTDTPETETPVTTEAPPATTEAPPATTEAPPATTEAPAVTEEPTSSVPTAAPIGGSTPTATPAPPSENPLSDTVSYTVTFGDTVNGLAIRFNTTEDAIILANDLPSNGLIFVNQQLEIPVPTGQGDQPTDDGQPQGGGSGTVVVYTVQQGDTLSAISRQYNTTVDSLTQYNNLVNSFLIFPGQEIQIPPSADQQDVVVTTQPALPAPQNYYAPNGALVHVVQFGENLFRIGLYYNVTWDVIARANGVFNPMYIVPGQLLVIPQGGYFGYGYGY